MPLADPQVDTAVSAAVERARAEGIVLRIGEAARRIREQNPECPLASRVIADELARKAIGAGIPIQFTDPGD